MNIYEIWILLNMEVSVKQRSFGLIYGFPVSLIQKLI